MKKNNKGFTLAEMLIVVAIIGILVAILIPTFTTQMEKAREAADAGNIRSAIAEVTANWLSEGGTQTKSVKLTQTNPTWSHVTEIGGLSGMPNIEMNGSVKTTVTVSIDAQGNVTCN